MMKLMMIVGTYTANQQIIPVPMGLGALPPGGGGCIDGGAIIGAPVFVKGSVANKSR